MIVFPLPYYEPNSAHWNILKLRNASVTNINHHYDLQQLDCEGLETALCFSPSCVLFDTLGPFSSHQLGLNRLIDMEQEYSVPECPVCLASYDNVFKTPLLLPCSHTFCMECLSKLCIFQKELEPFHCPVCRAVAPIPTGGIPQLPPNMNVVSQFPPWMGELQQVWMEGSKLCWKKKHDHNYVTSTQNTELEENMVIDNYLLAPTPPHFSHTVHMGMVPQQPPGNRCNLKMQKHGRILCTLISCFAFLFVMIYFPLNLIL
ncbi:RING finger protein 223-like [Hyla sarda]|uniref:RING finger protein 223-like n=1 Tax=Hyla sarda TaxID=327740 RepID=UPI0024C2A602|nr:RING finger protein 223-like [Hyla sarda]